MEIKGGDGKVGCSPADIDGCHPHAGAAVVFRAGASHKAAEQARVSLVFSRNFIVHVNKLGACGFVPITAYDGACAVICAGGLPVLH